MINLTNPIWGELNIISASRINSYIKCGYKFEIEYIHGMRVPGGLNMHRGTSIHKAIEEDNKHFMVTGKRLDLSTLFEHGKEEFDKNLKAGVRNRNAAEREET